MRKISLIGTLVIAVFIFSNCHTPKKTMTVTAPKVTYQGNVQALISATCTPCHIPSKGGNKKPLDTYASAQGNIDDMIRRIELNPTDRGFMPFKHAKLSDSTIAVFKQWKTDGLLEK